MVPGCPHSREGQAVGPARRASRRPVHGRLEDEILRGVTGGVGDDARLNAGSTRRDGDDDRPAHPNSVAQNSQRNYDLGQLITTTTKLHTTPKATLIQT
jgi:hypothetical protein